MSYQVKPDGSGRRFVLDTPFLRIEATISKRGRVKVRQYEIRDPAEQPAHSPEPSRGLGDTFAKITKAAGVKPCGKCKKRQAKLNRLIPYKSSADKSPA